MSQIPLRERISCSVPEALELTGLGRTKFYELVDSSAVRTKTVGRRRLVLVSSLIAFLESDDS